MGTDFQGLHDQLRIGVHRQDQHLAVRAYGLQLAQGIEPADIAHRQVEQDDIRVQSFDGFEQLGAIAGFANHGIARNFQYQGAYTGPDQ